MQELVGFKASKTLLGIETDGQILRHDKEFGFKASKTLLGIETLSSFLLATRYDDSKPLKPF